MNIWQEVNTQISNADLITHTKYAEFMSKNTQNLIITYSGKINSKPIINSKLDKTVILAKMTKASIEQEFKQVAEQKEYVRACASWVCVKSYYLQYYLETILIYLINTNEANLNSKHTTNRTQIRELISNGKLDFSNIFYKTVGQCKVYEKTGLKSGDGLRNISDEDRYKQIMKKLREYALDEFKIMKKIKRLTGAKKAEFNEKDICLIDYFYWYRIKSNYRDLNFIADENAKTDAIYEFYNNYTKTIISMTDAYITLINDIYSTRMGAKKVLLP